LEHKKQATNSMQCDSLYISNISSAAERKIKKNISFPKNKSIAFKNIYWQLDFITITQNNN
jgi:hypothetical protein